MTSSGPDHPRNPPGPGGQPNQPGSGPYPQRGPYPQPGQYPQQGQYGAPGQYAQPNQFGQWAPPPRPMRTRGGKILTFSGIGVLILGIVALVAAGSMFFSQLPFGIIGSDGGPGSDARASAGVPGTMQVEADAGELLTLWETAPSRADLGLRSTDVEIVGPDGSSVRTTAGIGGYSDMHGVSARTVANFSARDAGTYTITVLDTSAATLPDHQVIVAPGTEVGDFFTTIGGSIGLVFVGIAGLTIGGLMAIGGAIWWGVAHSRTRRAAEYEAARA